MTYHFSVKETGVVRLGHTNGWLGKTLEILAGSRPACLAGKTISVHLTPERELFLYRGKKRLQHRMLQPEARPKAVQQAKPPTSHAKPPNPAALARRRAWLHGRSHKTDGNVMCEV